MTNPAPIFAIPYSSISLSTVQGKNEVAVELNQSDKKNQGDVLTEIRFYVQNNELDKRGEDEEAQIGDDEEDMTAAKVFNHRLVLLKDQDKLLPSFQTFQ